MQHGGPTSEAAHLTQFVTLWLNENVDRLIEWRRHLHRNPELSHMEDDTTAFIMGILRDAGLEPQEMTCKGATVDIGPETAPMIAFRGDIDALPVTETTGLDFSSTVPGVMHACGHDMHTTILLGLMVSLAVYVEEYGEDALSVRVRGIFQPAEEVLDGGAKDVIAAGALRGVNQIFAVHCEPKLRCGQIGVRVGAITSATDVMEIVLRGPGGHTSRPHLTADVINAAGLVVTMLPQLLSRRVDPRSGTVAAFGSIHGGQAFNAIPEEVRLVGSFRTAEVGVWRESEEIVRELLDEIVAPTGATAELRYTKGVPPVTNDDVATALLAQSVRNVDPHSLVEAPQSSGGEDFSWYLEHVPGSMARLGTWTGEGDKPDLHRPNIIFDERALGIGVRLFAGVIDQFRP